MASHFFYLFFVYTEQLQISDRICILSMFTNTLTPMIRQHKLWSVCGTYICFLVIVKLAMAVPSFRSFVFQWRENGDVMSWSMHVTCTCLFISIRNINQKIHMSHIDCVYIHYTRIYVNATFSYQGSFWSPIDWAHIQNDSFVCWGMI